MFTCLKKPLQSSSRNNSARVNGQDHKKLPAHGTNPIAGFGEFYQLTNWLKNKKKITRLTFRALALYVRTMHFLRFFPQVSATCWDFASIL